MIILLLFGSPTGNLAPNIMKVEEKFYKRFKEVVKATREAVLNAEFELKDVAVEVDEWHTIAERKGDEKLTDLRQVDLLELFLKARKVLSDKESKDSQRSKLEHKWTLISQFNVLGLYCNVLEGCEKETHQSLFNQVVWHDEIRDLLALVDIHARAIY